MPKTDIIESKSALLEVLKWLTDRERNMVEQVRELVVRESPTHDKSACDALCNYLAQQFEAVGGRVKINRQPKAGNHLQVEFAGPRGRKALLLLGHYDTVYDLGTLAIMPWREYKGRLLGPGVFDMKSGIAQIMFALQALKQIKGDLAQIGRAHV